MARTLGILVLLVSACCCLASPFSEGSRSQPGFSDIQFRWLRDELRDELRDVQELEEERAIYQNCGHKTDIFFVIDSSNSIHPDDFELQLGFVTHIIEKFDVGADRVHIGMLLFADDTMLRLELGDLVNSKNAMIQKIMSTDRIYGNTFTNKGLELMRNEMAKRGRRDAPHIAIVITDGESDYRDLTAQQALISRDAGITIFALGVGYADQTELKLIASGRDKVFYVDSYDALDSIERQLAEKTCKVTPPPTTTIPTTTQPPYFPGCEGASAADLLLAAPDEAGVQDSRRVAGFFSDVVGLMELGRTKARVGVTPRLCSESTPGSQCSSPTHRLPAIFLWEFDEQRPLQDAIEQRVLGSTQLSQQLDYLINDGFPPHEAHRADAKRTAILVVDNQSMFPQVARQLASEAKNSHDVNIIIVGVGNDVDEQELKKIASTPQDAFFVNSYDELRNLVDPKIKNAICRGLSQ